MKLYLVEWNYKLSLLRPYYVVRTAVVRAETPEAAYKALGIAMPEPYTCTELTADGDAAVVCCDIRQPGDDY